MKADGARAVFDWAAMAAAWELDDEFLGQDALRKPPDDGIHDAALDARVQRHLRKWSPVSATILSLTRTTMFGLQTLNFDVELELADGSRSFSKRDDVPSYAQWWAAPGAVVPAVVDPEDTTKANIDWPAFALAKRRRGRLRRRSARGQHRRRARAAGGGHAGDDGTTRAPRIPRHRSTLDMSMRSWVDMRRNGR